MDIAEVAAKLPGAHQIQLTLDLATKSKLYVTMFAYDEMLDDPKSMASLVNNLVEAAVRQLREKGLVPDGRP